MVRCRKTLKKEVIKSRHYSRQEVIERFSTVKTKVFRYAKRVFKIPPKMRFFLYTLADGLSEVLKKITKPLLQLWTTKPEYQLSLNFGRLL